MDARELRTKSPAELADELVKLRKEQFALRMQRATGQAPKPDQFGKVRRNIARLKTVLREKQRAGAASAGGGTAGGAAGRPHAHRARGEQQDAEDDRGRDRAPGAPSDLR